MIRSIEGAKRDPANGTAQRRCLSVEEVSEQTTLSKSTVRNMIKDGRLNAKRLGRRVVILAEELDKLLAA